MTSLTRKDVEIVASRAGLLNSNSQVTSYQFEPFSKLKNGILGQHQLLRVQISDPTLTSDTHQSFFVKSFSDESMVSGEALDAIIFEETHFYDKVLPVLLETCENQEWLPKCYLVQPEVLVFEDLRSQDLSIRESFPLSEMDIRSALSSLAEFHACSLVVQGQGRKQLTEIFPNAFKEKAYTNDHKFGEMMILGFKTIELMARKLGLDSNLVTGISRRVYESVRPAKDARVPNVICHSDLWKNNLMFDQSQPPKCVLVDFQLLRYASPSIDVGMLLYINSTPEFRRKLECQMIEHYYEALRHAILRSDAEIVVPSYEAIKKDWRKRRIVGMTYACMYLPGLYLKKEKLEVLMNDPKALDKWMYEDRFELISEAIDQDPVYEEKIREIVAELIEEEKRLLRDG
ncbi:hypothetical protein QAD02_015771 [Eretmocerus hayati]|uniref:Uncharacterized protein n=1 Tax=Eretmocerus hayati TaxID=131215 RepID=A0ACC2PBM6_9HYME|nr:hypothetical protein QAD02_015771 [Eretmocerus hayati]